MTRRVLEKLCTNKVYVDFLALIFVETHLFLLIYLIQ